VGCKGKIEGKTSKFWGGGKGKGGQRQNFLFEFLSHLGYRLPVPTCPIWTRSVPPVPPALPVPPSGLRTVGQKAPLNFDNNVQTRANNVGKVGGKKLGLKTA
jgi:hypothetical protein